MTAKIAALEKNISDNKVRYDEEFELRLKFEDKMNDILAF